MAQSPLEKLLIRQGKSLELELTANSAQTIAESVLKHEKGKQYAELVQEIYKMEETDSEYLNKFRTLGGFTNLALKDSREEKFAIGLTTFILNYGLIKKSIDKDVSDIDQGIATLSGRMLLTSMIDSLKMIYDNISLLKGKQILGETGYQDLKGKTLGLVDVYQDKGLPSHDKIKSVYQTLS
ncbi:MAG: hypothetical protein ABIC95_07155 [archaeon]